jgi:hypothetical protein
MFVIRETFTAKPGQASTLARLCKQTMGELTQFKCRILTDYIAAFNTVVMEVEVDDLGAFEKMMAEYTTRQDVRDKMKGYADMYITGKREVYRVV